MTQNTVEADYYYAKRDDKFIAGLQVGFAVDNATNIESFTINDIIIKDIESIRKFYSQNNIYIFNKNSQNFSKLVVKKNKRNILYFYTQEGGITLETFRKSYPNFCLNKDEILDESSSQNIHEKFDNNISSDPVSANNNQNTLGQNRIIDIDENLFIADPVNQSNNVLRQNILIQVYFYVNKEENFSLKKLRVDYLNGNHDISFFTLLEDQCIINYSQLKTFCAKNDIYTSLDDVNFNKLELFESTYDNKFNLIPNRDIYDKSTLETLHNNAFSQNNSAPSEILHNNAFPQNNSAPSEILHNNAFSQNNSAPSEILHNNAFSQNNSAPSETLHNNAFSQNNSAPSEILHNNASSQNNSAPSETLHNNASSQNNSAPSSHFLLTCFSCDYFNKDLPMLLALIMLMTGMLLVVAAPLVGTSGVLVYAGASAVVISLGLFAVSARSAKHPDNGGEIERTSPKTVYSK